MDLMHTIIERRRRRQNHKIVEQLSHRDVNVITLAKKVFRKVQVIEY